MTELRRLLVLVSAAAWIGAACNDSSGPGPETLTLGSTAALDGFVYIGAAERADATGGGPSTGDIDAFVEGVNSRQFYSFDLATLPTGADITTATLRLYQANASSGVYGELGNVVVDHLDYGTTLDVDDHSAAALTEDIGTLSTDATIEYKVLDVTAAVEDDRAAGRTRSQFRLRFETPGNDDGTNDFAQFTDPEESCGSLCVGNPPQLVIEYAAP